jgi:hypothetical protein
MPSEFQRKHFWPLVFVQDGVDEHGWWLGWCPLHDEAHDPRHASAQYHFGLGSYRCLADKPCHAPKKAMSLSNLRMRVEAKRA